MTLYELLHKYAQKIDDAMRGKGVDILDVYLGKKEAYVLVPLILSTPFYEILDRGKEKIEELLTVEDILDGHYPNPCELHTAKASVSAMSWFPGNGFAMHSNGAMYNIRATVSPENSEEVIRKIAGIFEEYMEEYNEFMNRQGKKKKDEPEHILKTFPK